MPNDGNVNGSGRNFLLLGFTTVSGKEMKAPALRNGGFFTGHPSGETADQATSPALFSVVFFTLRSKYIVSALRQKSYFYFIFQYDEAAGSIDKRPPPGKI